MTNDRMALAELIEKGSDADLLREMIGFVAQRLMDVDVESLCGASYGERTVERANSRNGYRGRFGGPARFGQARLEPPIPKNLSSESEL